MNLIQSQKTTGPDTGSGSRRVKDRLRTETRYSEYKKTDSDLRVYHSTDRFLPLDPSKDNRLPLKKIIEDMWFTVTDTDANNG